MVKLPELKLNDEAQMRALYERCGISKSTTEAAIKLRRNMPVQQEGNEKPRKPSPLGNSEIAGVQRQAKRRAVFPDVARVYFRPPGGGA